MVIRVYLTRDSAQIKEMKLNKVAEIRGESNKKVHYIELTNQGTDVKSLHVFLKYKKASRNLSWNLQSNLLLDVSYVL